MNFTINNRNSRKIAENEKNRKLTSYKKMTPKAKMIAVTQKLHTKDFIRIKPVISSSSFSRESAMKHRETSRPSIPISLIGSVVPIKSRETLSEPISEENKEIHGHCRKLNSSSPLKRVQRQIRQNGTNITSPILLNLLGNRKEESSMKNIIYLPNKGK
ncbi:MAG: hypothetical protein MJY53_01955 [Bacteroidales bacterium]|nr:hypothetical protein [Bacteroidales bacterium]